jgi:hypothetical protein
MAIREEDREMRGEILSGPDNKGRYRYFLMWKDDYFPGHPGGEHVVRERAQIFFGPLREGIPYTMNGVAFDMHA